MYWRYVAGLLALSTTVLARAGNPSASVETTPVAYPCGNKPVPSGTEDDPEDVTNALIGEKLQNDAGHRKLAGNHVINGNEAAAGSWPWMASVQFLDEWTQTYYHVCGGVLISLRWVLTAAHCVDAWVSGDGRDDHTKYQIMLGGHDLYELSGNEQFLTLDCIIKHHQWNPDVNSGLPNDIAMLKLSSVADVSRNNIGVVCLPGDVNADYRDAECWISGWGFTEYGAEYPPNRLHEGKTGLISNEVCGQLLPFDVLDTHICVGTQQRPNACEGDSGGPLSCRQRYSQTWDLAGISSWGFNFCDGVYPSVFTRVSMYETWIKETIANSPCPVHY